MQRNWKLEDIYHSVNDERLVRDRALLESSVSNFREEYKGKLSIENFKSSVESYENILGIFEKISAYSFLYLQTQLNDIEALSFYQSTTELLCRLHSHIVFYTVEIVVLDYDSIINVCPKYKSWIDSCFRYKEHMLTNEAEEVLSRKYVTSRSSWIRLYDEILAKMEFDFEGQIKTLPEILELSNHSEDGLTREKAAKIVGAKLKEESFFIKHIYNNILLDCSIDNNLRKYEKSESFRHVDNNIDQKSVDLLTNAVIDGYKKTSHKYYRLKAKLLGKKTIEYWDRNAPIRLSSILNKEFTYEKGCEIVLDTFGSFSQTFRDIATDFIEKDWIDVFPRKGKTSGAFSHHCSCEIHPYILLNYFGNVRDISTLAHELGHGIHQTLAAKNGPILADTPITISEVASLFAEKMLFEKMFEQAETDLERIDLLCSKLDDTVNSVMRQIAFFEFERQAHKMRKSKELSEFEISEIWMEIQKDCLGGYVNLDETISSYWCYISHFFHSPFYVYAYAFGEIFVNALYNSYRNSGNEFVEKYVNMLSKGGIDKYDIVAANFGLDPLKAEFWNNGIEEIATQIERLETLCDRALCN